MIMNAGLARYSALFISPMYQGLLVITGALSGIAFFGELKSMPTLNIIIYFVGIAIMCGGIGVLCVLQGEHEEEGVEKEGEGNNAKEASSDDNNSDIKISMDDVDPKALAASKGVDDKGKGDSPSLSVDSVELELSDKPEVESSNA